MHQAKYAKHLARFFGVEPEDIPQAIIEGAEDESGIDALVGGGNDHCGGMVLGLSSGALVPRGVADDCGGGTGNREQSEC